MYVEPRDEEEVRDTSVSREEWTYTIAALDEKDPVAGTYFPGRCACIVLSTPTCVSGRVIGNFGILLQRS
jgi:hypothetical protein